MYRIIGNTEVLYTVYKRLFPSRTELVCLSVSATGTLYTLFDFYARVLYLHADRARAGQTERKRLDFVLLV